MSDYAVSATKQHHVFNTMGTSVHVTVVDSDPRVVRDALEGTEAIFHAWDARFSRFREDSELMRLNNAAGHWLSVSGELYDVIAQCLYLAQSTQGVFDPSVGAYLAAHGYGLPKNFHLVDSPPDYHAIQLDPQQQRIRLARGQVLEPAAIVKGMAIDAAGKKLRGLAAWIINAGGDILTSGPYNHGDWVIGIQDPDQPDAIVSAVKIHNEALATSGDYAVRWIEDDGAWHHQIDTKTGRSTNDLRSVSVIATTAREADIFTSIAFLKGRVAALEYLNRIAVPYLLIDRSRQCYKNTLFADREVSPTALLSHAPIH